MSFRAAWSIGAVGVIILAAGIGCGQLRDQNSGEDARRAGAVQVPVGAPVDDRASAPDGDHTDWKRFELDIDSEVRVEVWWDDPDVEATVTLRDAFADSLARVEHEPGRRKDVVGPVAVGAGEYFLEIVVTDGASVYTLEIHVEATAAPRPGF